MNTVESTATRILLQTGVSKTKNINPYLPSGPVHPYQLEESISNFRGVWRTFFIFILFRIDIPVSKQWSPWSDAALCGVWSRSALFAYVPEMGRLIHSCCVFFYVSFPNVLILIDRSDQMTDRQNKYMSFKMSCFILLEKHEKTEIDLAFGKVSRFEKHTCTSEINTRRERKGLPGWFSNLIFHHVFH